jgi:hypothetical protein
LKRGFEPVQAPQETTPERPLQFSRGEVIEGREGVCRLGAGLARELGQHSGALREAVGPHAENLARELLKAPDHQTPLKRERRRGSKV